MAPPAEERQPAAEGVFAGEEGLLLDQLRADLEAAKDRLLRSQAELDNYRKRAAREIEDNRRYANLPLIRDLLPVLDNLERAIAAAEKTPRRRPACWRASSWSTSSSRTCWRATTACGSRPCTSRSIRTCTTRSCSSRSDEVPARHGAAVTQPGFQLHDRVVRPSQVIVSGSHGPGALGLRGERHANLRLRVRGVRPSVRVVPVDDGRPKRKCPECGRQKLRRLIGPGAAIVFKGSGFYTTDYRSESYKKAAAADKSNAPADKSARRPPLAPRPATARTRATPRKKPRTPRRQRRKIVDAAVVLEHFVGGLAAAAPPSA